MNYDAYMLLWENAHIKVKHMECVVNNSGQKKEVMKYSSLLIITVTSALLGGFLVLLADTVGRSILEPSEIPAGIVVAVFGAPYFLFLLARLKE